MAEEKKNHTLLKVIGGVTAGAAAAYGGFSYYVFRNAFDVQKSSFYGNRQKVISYGNNERKQWFAHSVRDDEFLNSYDGLKLHALRITNHDDSNNWMILVHGAGMYSGDMLDYMYEADARGFNILAIDQRGCGMSEGKYTGLGWNEHYDLISWINYLVTLDHNAKIALFGLNIGAATVMNALGDYIPSNVKCAIEDGGYAGIQEILTHVIRQTCKIEPRPFIPAIDVLVRQFLHFSMYDISTKRQLEQCEIPMLFMHGTDDSVVPTSMVFDNYYACASEKELYTAEGKGFADTSSADDYFDSLFAFIDKHIA